MTLIAKIILASYMLDEWTTFISDKNVDLELILYIDSSIEDCAYITYILMLYQLSLAIRNTFGTLSLK